MTLLHDFTLKTSVHIISLQRELVRVFILRFKLNKAVTGKSTFSRLTSAARAFDMVSTEMHPIQSVSLCAELTLN